MAHTPARDESGTKKPVSKLIATDLRAAHKYALVLDRAYVSTVGYTLSDNFTALVDKLLAGFPQQITCALTEKTELGFGEGLEVIDFATS